MKKKTKFDIQTYGDYVWSIKRKRWIKYDDIVRGKESWYSSCSKMFNTINTTRKSVNQLLSFGVLKEDIDVMCYVKRRNRKPIVFEVKLS